MPARDLKIDPLLHHPERHGIYTVKIKITLRLYFTSLFHDDYELQIQNFCRFVKILEYRNFLHDRTIFLDARFQARSKVFNFSLFAENQSFRKFEMKKRKNLFRN